MLYQTISLILIAILASVYVMTCPKCGKDYLKHKHHFEAHVKQCNARTPFGAGVSGWNVTVPTPKGPKVVRRMAVAAHHLFLEHVHIGSNGIGITPILHQELYEQIDQGNSWWLPMLPTQIHDEDEYCPDCGLQHSFEFAVTVIQLDGQLIQEETLTCIGEDCSLNTVKPQPTKKRKRTSRIDLVVPCFRTNKKTGERVRTGVMHVDVNEAFKNSDLRRRKATPEEVSKKLRNTNTDEVTAFYEGIKLPTETPVESRPRRRPLPQARRGGPRKTAPEATGEEAQDPDSLENLLAQFQKENSF